MLTPLLSLLLAVSPNDTFHALRDHLLDAWLADSPAWARQLGLHDYDGKVEKVDPAALAAQVKRLQEAAQQLAKTDEAALTPDDRLDLGLLRYQVANELFRFEDLDAPHKRPTFYESLFAVDSYVNLDYAPLEERQKRLLAHAEAALAQAHNVTENLRLPLPKPIVETAITVYKGYADYLRTDVTNVFAKVGSAEAQQKFKASTEKLAAAAQSVADWLTNKALPTADRSFALGEKRFLKLVEVQEGLHTTLPELKKMAEENLKQNREAFDKLAPKTKWTRPPAKELLSAARTLVDESRQFVVSHHIASLATADNAEVRESPPYMRWNSASLTISGPFDSAHRAFYYITPPNPAWPVAEQEAYIPTRGTLLSTTIHEVYPGHFLQGRWLERAPTRAQKMIGSYGYIEGWAHYIEQMMMEEGFHQGDAEGHLGQLSDALLRNCRFVVSLGLHTEGMTLEAAERRFLDECHQDVATAREQAIRGTFDPGYFAYTVGKLEILSLRKEAKERLGDKFSLQRFHDALLAHGAPPIPLVHDRVLEELGAGGSGTLHGK